MATVDDKGLAGGKHCRGLAQDAFGFA